MITSFHFRLLAITLVACIGRFAQAATSFRYFYDDANELYRILDSTGTLLEYTYDPSGNILNVTRSTVLPSQLTIFNVTPSHTIGGSTITILGQNFSSVATGDTVLIGGIVATVVSATATQLVVTVPAGSRNGTLSVTVGGSTATWSNTLSILQSPFINSVSPASGKKGTTVVVQVVGTDMFQATFALQSVDPIDTAAGGAVTVMQNTGTMATMSLALGTTEGPFSLVGTNSVGTGIITPGSLFMIGPAAHNSSYYASVLNTTDNLTTNPPFPPGNNSAVAYASVLNAAYNPVTDPPLPPGQNSVSDLASVLNISDNLTTNPPYPPGNNSVEFYASVLNTSFGSVSPLPAGQNTSTFYASVLNTSDNLTTNPPFPPGHNSSVFYASVLNTGFNPTTNPLLPAGQNSVSYYISVCNTDSGCTYTPPQDIPAQGLQKVNGQLPVAGATTSSLNGSLPVLEPVAGMTSVTVGQTVRLSAPNVEKGSSVEFDVNQEAIATISEPPYETLFTVPNGPSDLDFHVVVRTANDAPAQSQQTILKVVPASTAGISGSVAEGTSGMALSLAAGGLKADFFRLGYPLTTLPVLDILSPSKSSYVTAINEPNPGAVFGDDPLGAHLGSDYAIRFSGEVHASLDGTYRFWLSSRTRAALLIDGKPVTDTGFVMGEPSETSASVALVKGWHSIEVTYYLAVGISSLRLEWQQPTAERKEVLGPEYLRTVLDGMTATTGPDGAFKFPQVPTIFDSVWIRAKQGAGFIEFSPVKPGASSISLIIPK